MAPGGTCAPFAFLKKAHFYSPSSTLDKGAEAAAAAGATASPAARAGCCLLLIYYEDNP